MSRVIGLVFCAAMLLPLPLVAKVWLTGLTVEGRRNPVGIDDTAPRFGWQIVSDRRNVMQRSYRIIVASSEEGINNNVGDVWDSGIVASDSSQWVTSGVISLKPNSRYFWKVEVTTNRGRSGWSEPAIWTTGLMSDDAWRGCWIGLDSLMPWDSAERHSRISSRYLRKRFDVRATMHISGLGLYTLHINGVRVGDDVLTPVPTDYTHSVIYNTYDVTQHLAEGMNAIGVVLAGGHYFAQTQNFQTNVRTTYGYPKLIANLIIEYADGKADTVVTDTSWRLTADGPIRYANEYDGELYDETATSVMWLRRIGAFTLVIVHSKDPARKTDGRLLASSYYYYLCRMMQNYATLLGHNDDSRHFGHEAEAMAVALNDSLFVDGRYSNGTVTANLLPMAMGIVPDSCRAALADSITVTIRDKNGTRISCGVIGIQWLMRWLSGSGNGDLAYQLATADSYPSWGYMVRRGATTIWELWNGDTAAPSMNSGNHVMLLGDLLPWCYEHLAGIRTDGVRTGFRHVVLRPDFSIKALRGVTASHPSPYGVISSSWHRRQNGKTEWTVCVPANTTAEVHLPDHKPKIIGSGTYRFVF